MGLVYLPIHEWPKFMVKCKVNIPVSWKHLGRFWNHVFFSLFFWKEAGPAHPVDDHHAQGSYQPSEEQFLATIP